MKNTVYNSLQSPVPLKDEHSYYIASPYSHRDNYQQTLRYLAALQITASLMNEGYLVYSPVVYGHTFKEKFGLDGTWSRWGALDTILVSAFDGIIVLMLEGWEDSYGVGQELLIAKRNRKLIYYYDPRSLAFVEHDI